MSKLARSIGCLTLLLPWLAGWFDAGSEETWAGTVGTVVTRLGGIAQDIIFYSRISTQDIRFHSQISVKTTTTTNLREVYETVANVCTCASLQKPGTCTPPPEMLKLMVD